ncbi:MAG: aminodeoxychorismate/anthranilate synthase component II [Saprospiraceae bacterium]
MKILVIDNYDSFVYNLVHMLYNLGVEEIDIVKNDKVDLNTISAYDKILLSPGPGIPNDAGLMKKVIEIYAPSKSIIGVCLGHQAIGEVFGGSLINLDEPLHGVASRITILHNDYLFENTPVQFDIGHYHSWVVSPAVPDSIEIIATDEYGNIMALKHKNYDVRGVQFHPESVLTEFGKTIIGNWINH